MATEVAAADKDLPVSGLVLLGYPLHPPGRPADLRAAHLPGVNRPMLFVQGGRDTFGTPAELGPDPDIAFPAGDASRRRRRRSFLQGGARQPAGAGGGVRRCAAHHRRMDATGHCVWRFRNAPAPALTGQCPLVCMHPGRPCPRPLLPRRAPLHRSRRDRLPTRLLFRSTRSTRAVPYGRYAFGPMAMTSRDSSSPSTWTTTK